MMVGSESGGSKGRNTSQDFELNLASIIDCLTVLITFLLASATFLSVGILDAGIAAAGNQATPTAPPPITITIELARDQTLTLKWNGKQNGTVAVPKLSDGKADYAALNQRLAELKGKWPEVNAAILTADSAAEYRDVVKSMEAIRKTLPVVALGGF